MRQHKSATWWLVGVGALLLLVGAWLATLTMKRHERMRSVHAGPWTGLIRQAK